MLARIIGSVSRQESEHKGERRRRANLQRAEAGTWRSDQPRLFGYTRTGEHLEPEATAIRQAITRCARWPIDALDRDRVERARADYPARRSAGGPMSNRSLPACCRQTDPRRPRRLPRPSGRQREHGKPSPTRTPTAAGRLPVGPGPAPGDGVRTQARRQRRVPVRGVRWPAVRIVPRRARRPAHGATPVSPTSMSAGSPARSTSSWKRPCCGCCPTPTSCRG